jgi:hypothetical protein
VEKLKASRFKQQMLPAWRPVPSFGSTMIIFAIFGIVFLCLGIVLYIMSDKIQEVQSGKYNAVCGGPTSTFCEFSLLIEEDIEAPIYVYYQLENFYQNHRRYVKSKDAKQLAGNDRTVDELSDCAPIITNADLAAPSNTTTFY